MKNDLLREAAPLEPFPKDWLTPARLEALLGELGTCISLIRRAGLLRAVLGYWVRWQASLEAEWPMEEENHLLDELVTEWITRKGESNKLLSEQDLRSKLRVAPAIARWSRQQWGHRLESIYLKRKNLLDRASCRLLRLADKELALEIYHRIKAGETSFEEASHQFGIPPERYNGGLYELQPLYRFPFGLAPLLERLVPGQLTMPIRLGEGFCLVRLERYEPCQFDSGTEELLLSEQLQLWIDSVVDELEAVLAS